MRKLLVASTVCALTGVAMLAGAADRSTDGSAGARAYLSYAFGGNATKLPRNFHYGLRLDAGSRIEDGATRPSLMQIDFDRAGLNAARINGLSVVQRLRLNQDDAPADAPVDEPAPAEESLSEDSSGSGEPTTTYSVVDWTLIAVGVVGIGYAAAEALDAEESEVPPPEEEEGGGGLLAGLPLLSLQQMPMSMEDRERQTWMDGGSGQMGDLASQ